MTTTTLPFGGQYIKQILDQGPIVIILCGILFLGYKRYTKIVDGFAADVTKFMNNVDGKITGLEIKINKLLRKEEIE